MTKAHSSAKWSAAAFRRIGKTASALAGGQVTNILIQVLLPPAFIMSYGVKVYGEWLALSAGAAWLLTLDFGLQAFTTNQVSIEYFGGNVTRVRQLQSVGLRISLAVVFAGLLLAGGLVWLVPLSSVLGLSMRNPVASAIAMCLVAQVLGGIVWSQLNGILRAVGYPHRAEVWAQIQRAAYLAITYILVLRRAPLWLVPVGQLVPYMVATVVSLIDLRGLAPEAFPTIRYWDRETARSILKPSLWFGSFTVNQFLLFQVPVLVLNQTAGKQAVVVFSLCRTLFGLVRQALLAFRAAVRPEITRLAGWNDWRRLGRLYEVCERLAFSSGIVASAAVFLAAPRVVALWTRRADLFDAPLYAAMMVSTMVIIGKDTRLELQYATNRHVRAAAICLFSYLVFAAGTIPAAMSAGAVGIVVLWTAVEITQMVLLHRENRELVPTLSYANLLKLCMAGLACWAIFVPIADIFARSSWVMLLLGLILAGGGLGACAAAMFGLTDAVQQVLRALKTVQNVPAAEATL